MSRLVLFLLPALLIGCESPRLGSGLGPRLDAARVDVPMGGAARGDRDPRLEACRSEATRVVQFRERGQTMRTDETENSRGTITVAPFSRVENDRAASQLDRDRLIQDCLRASQSVANPAGGR